MMIENQLMPEKEAAKLAGFSRAAFIKWRREGRSPRYIRVGRSIRYRVSDLVAWIQQHTVEQSSSACGLCGSAKTNELEEVSAPTRRQKSESSPKWEN